MYAALCRFTREAGAGVWFTALDRLRGRAYWVLQQRFADPFLPYYQGKLNRGTLAPGVYFAHVDGDRVHHRTFDLLGERDAEPAVSDRDVG